MRIVVTGIGLISALGDRETTWLRLLSRESGLLTQCPFPNLTPRPLGIVGSQVANLLALQQEALKAALVDAQLVLPLPDCAVVVGSSRSQQVRWEQLCQTLATSDWRGSPPSDLSSFPETLPHQPAIATARWLGATGPVLAPMAACATGLWAIVQGMQLIQTGQCQRAIVGAVETPITPLTLAGFEQMGALAKTGAYPFDRHREGLALGEAAVMLVLETAALAQQRSAPVYGELRGFGLTADGYHVSAPKPDSREAMVAVRQCLERSQLRSDQIDYIHAHGTATRLNDQNEANLIQNLFPQGVAVSSTKGATGHTLGASGALGAAFCLLALQRQVLPPCVGCQDLEFDLDIVDSPRSGSVSHALCFSFGFGGQNAVLALSREGWGDRGVSFYLGRREAEPTANS